MEKVAQNTFRKKPAEQKAAPKPQALPTFKVMPFLRDKRTHVSAGVALVLFSFFLLFALVSHVFTGRADQSLMRPDAEMTVLNAGREAENWMGYAGAWMSDLLMYHGFGLGSLLIAPLVFALGYRIVFSRPLVGGKRAFGRVLVFAILWISCTMGVAVVQTGAEQHWGWLAGSVGYEMSAAVYGFLGWSAWFLIALSAATFLIFYYNATSFGQVRQKVAEELSTINQVNKMERSIARQIPTEPVVADDDEAVLAANAPTLIESEAGEAFELTLNPNGITARPARGPAAEPVFEVNLPQVEEPVFVPEVEEETTAEFTYVPPVEEAVGNRMGHYDPTLDLSSYKFPVLDLLEDHGQGSIMVDQQELQQNKDTIVSTLLEYNISIESIKATVGPTVTLYEIKPSKGNRISKIKNLEDDIALSLAALGIRIIAPMPGQGTIGIEVPNKKREVVSVRSLLSTEKFMKSDMALPIALGKTISNEVFITDLAKMPHLLMAGATGQGKSVGLNVLLTSLIYKKHPSQLKFVLVDPKKVELSIFSTIERHFLAKLPNSEEAIITDTRKVVNTLNSLCILMDQRYDLLKEAGCRNLKEYNHKFVERHLNPEKGHHYMPYIVLVIDELADLMMTAGKEVETPIARLAQLARAIGIHLVVATQRPSVNVITGLIKANFPARLSFKVTSKIDSRTILDTGGADRLIGYGDMLLSLGSDLIRLQCPFVDTPEVERLCSFVGEQRGYPTAYYLPEYVGEGEDGDDLDDFDPVNRDAMFDDAARTIVQYQQGSTSLLQRKHKLGYARAGRLMDQLEAAGIVGPFEGGKPRDVLYKDLAHLEHFLNELDGAKRLS